ATTECFFSDALDQISELELRLLDRVATHEARALEDGVVQLARAPVVRADRADQRSRLNPLASKNGVTRSRRRDHDVLSSRVLVHLARLRVHLPAERVQPLLVAAIRDDPFDRRHRLPDARDLALGLPPAAEDAPGGR